MNKATDFLRFGDTEPLILTVSALSDFLWEDFVRERSPLVTYLESQFTMTKLSRFGKELFEFLYNGGEVSTVISLDDVEEYFREQQNGNNPDFPKGYKPENAIWFHLFNQVCDAPAWPQLVAISMGDQFNAGNNAVNVLNGIGEALDREIEQRQIDAQMLADLSKELQKLREDFMQAKQAGDLTKAAKLRQQGKELGKQIEQEVKDAANKLQPRVNRAVDEAHEKAKDFQEAMSQLAGSETGEGKKLDNLQEKKALAKKLAKNPQLRELVRKLGALKQSWANRKRAKTATANYSDIVGARFSDEVIKAYPAEIALAATDEGRALFALKYSQKTILTKDYEAKSKELDRGPVIMYIDISGSMGGEQELWSKAIAYVVADECLKQNRDTYIHLFDNHVDKSVYLSKTRSDNKKLLDFVLAWTTGGGTSFEAVLRHAMNKRRKDLAKADVLMITDGRAWVSERTIRELKELKDEIGLQWSTFCIEGSSDTAEDFSDYVHSVSCVENENTAGLFQDAMR